MGRPELLDDPRFASVAERRRNHDELMAELADWAGTQHDVAAVEHRLAHHELAMGVLRTVREIADSSWAAERGAIVAVPDRRGGTIRIPNSPWHFSDADSGVRGQPAYRGEHNREVLRHLLGIDDATINRLEHDGVLSSRVPS
jgi:crotonobetainyl-CoA:carnitine CoA-transferase CaiB-like acyl-CoA transferase